MGIEQNKEWNKYSTLNSIRLKTKWTQLISKGKKWKFLSLSVIRQSKKKKKNDNDAFFFPIVIFLVRIHSRGGICLEFRMQRKMHLQNV